MDCNRFRKSSRLAQDILSTVRTIMMALVMGFVPVWLLLLWRSFILPLALRLLSGRRRLPIGDNRLTKRKFESVQDFANELNRKYGAIITLWAASKPVVIIISGPDIFSGHTHLPSKRILNFGSRGLTSRYCERHRFPRKSVRTETLSKKRAVGFRSIRDREVNLIERLQKKQVGVHSKGGNIVLGRRLTGEEYMEVDEVMVQRFQIRLCKPRDFIPVMPGLPFGEKRSEIFEPLIEERKQILKSGKMEQATFVQDTLLGPQSGEIIVISTKWLTLRKGMMHGHRLSMGRRRNLSAIKLAGNDAPVNTTVVQHMEKALKSGRTISNSGKSCSAMPYF